MAEDKLDADFLVAEVGLIEALLDHLRIVLSEIDVTYFNLDDLNRISAVMQVTHERAHALEAAVSLNYSRLSAGLDGKPVRSTPGARPV